MLLAAKTATAAGIFALLWIGEVLIPYYAQFTGGWRERLRHDGRNLTFGILNAVLAALLFGWAFAALEIWSVDRGLGLLRLLSWPPWAMGIAAILILDLWMYLWHRANHALPFLWRFHRMHHADTALDASTGIRFHTGEILLSALIRLPLFAVLGISLGQVALYEALFLPVVLFHHSNVRFPRWLDRGLLILLVTPAMHRVHHSRLREETDSNYGSLFPFWDRLARTFRLRHDPREIRPGLDGFDGGERQSFLGMLGTPLADRPGPRRRGRAMEASSRLAEPGASGS